MAPIKHTPNRSSKTEFMKRILQSNMLTKRKHVAKPDPKASFKQESLLANNYFDQKQQAEEGFEEEDPQGREEAEQASQRHDQEDMHLEPYEYATSDDEEQDGMLNQQLGIKKESVNYKLVKEFMYPDSKVRNEGLPHSPFPTMDFGGTPRSPRRQALPAPAQRHLPHALQARHHVPRRSLFA